MRLRMISTLLACAVVLTTTAGFTTGREPDLAVARHRRHRTTARPRRGQRARRLGQRQRRHRAAHRRRRASWQSVGPADTADLEFRDIEAFDAYHAVALAIGPGEAVAVYRTANGGATWTETFRNDRPSAPSTTAWRSSTTATAWRCPTRSTASSACCPLRTVDGPGRSTPPPACPPRWTASSPSRPAAPAWSPPTGRGRDAWFATGGGATARVFHTGNRGRSWTGTDTPVPSGPSAGIYSLAFRDPRHGIARRRRLRHPDERAERRGDQPRRRPHAGRSPGPSRESTVRARPGSPGRSPTLAVGPTGSDISVRRWPDLAALRHREPRLGRLHAGRRLLGLRRAGPDRLAALALSPPTTPTGHRAGSTPVPRHFNSYEKAVKYLRVAV